MLNNILLYFVLYVIALYRFCCWKDQTELVDGSRRQNSMMEPYLYMDHGI